MIVSKWAIFTKVHTWLIYNIVCVVILELLDVGVDQGLGIPALDAEFLLARESGCRKEDKLH